MVPNSPTSASASDASPPPSLLFYYAVGIVATTIGIIVVIVLNLATPLNLIPNHIAALRHFGDWTPEAYRIFGLRFAGILAAAYVPVLVAMRVMLRPVAACLQHFRDGRTPPPELFSRGRRRLLNLPFIFIPVSIGFWFVIPAAISAVAFLSGQMGGRTAAILGFRASMIGLIVSTVSFHRI